MEAYIRFQTKLRCGGTGRPAGIFIASGRVEDSPHTLDESRWQIRDHLNWFNRNLTIPSLDEDGWRSVFWFRSSAQTVIQRIWDLARILDEEGVYVRKIWTTKPGMIKYRDKYQIAAIPDRKSKVLRA